MIIFLAIILVLIILIMLGFCRIFLPRRFAGGDADKWWKESGKKEIDIMPLLRDINNIIIFTHGGCPDGNIAGMLAFTALHTIFPLEKIKIIELSHIDRAKKGADFIKPNTLILYVDISPFIEDVPLLEKAKHIIVLDHHAPTEDRLKKIKELLGQKITDLSNYKDNHSGTSIVAKYFSSMLNIRDLDRIVAIIRKIDVWKYIIPQEWEEDAKNAMAFFAKRKGCNIDTAKYFILNLKESLDEGKEFLPEQYKNDEELFKSQKEIKPNVYTFDLQNLSYNFEHLERLFKERLKPNSFILLIRDNPNNKERVIISVRRNSEEVGDLGKITTTLYEKNKDFYTNGGGHSVAAGLGVKRSVYDINKVAQDLLDAKSL